MINLNSNTLIKIDFSNIIKNVQDNNHIFQELEKIYENISKSEFLMKILPKKHSVKITQ